MFDVLWNCDKMENCIRLFFLENVPLIEMESIFRRKTLIVARRHLSKPKFTLIQIVRISKKNPVLVSSKLHSLGKSLNQLETEINGRLGNGKTVDFKRNIILTNIVCVYSSLCIRVGIPTQCTIAHTYPFDAGGWWKPSVRNEYTDSGYPSAQSSALTYLHIYGYSLSSTYPKRHYDFYLQYFAMFMLTSKHYS